MSSSGYELGTADTLEEVMERRTNVFDDLEVQELETQWKHKISAVPPDADGGGAETAITTRWWTYSSGVFRDGPAAQVPSGEQIRTDQSGDYTVGVPALAGGAARVEGTPVQNAGDDWWTGYTDRLNPNVTNPDGVGVGYSYFDAGEGDSGGADAAGDQEYVWFYSGVSGVSNQRIPRDQWNGELQERIDDGEFDDIDLSKGNLFHRGGFVRIDHTFYDEGAADVNYGIKTADGKLKIVTLHSFNIEGDEMWLNSDLAWEMRTETGGGNLTGYVVAAHYKSGLETQKIRFGGEGRDGTEFGAAVTVTAGDPIPLVSIQKRQNWRSISLTPTNFSVTMDNSFYVFVAVNTTLTGANFTEPNAGVGFLNRDDSEYAVLTDNEATDITDADDLEVFTFVPDAGNQGPAQVQSQDIELALDEEETVTLGVIPVNATTLEGSSMSWGSNY